MNVHVDVKGLSVAFTRRARSRATVIWPFFAAHIRQTVRDSQALLACSPLEDASTCCCDAELPYDRVSSSIFIFSSSSSRYFVSLERDNWSIMSKNF